MIHYSLVFSIAGFIIATCLTIIGFLLKSSSNKNRNDLEGLIKATENLKEASIELRSSVQHMKTSCVEKHSVIDKRLDDHSGILKNHTTKIAVINSKLKIKDL